MYYALKLYCILCIEVILCILEVESDRTVTREAGAGASGQMTRAPSSVSPAHRSPGYGDALVHGSDTIREQFYAV